MNKSMIVGMVLSAAMIPAQIVYAQNTTTTLTLVQGFGCGGHSDGGWCKAMVENDQGKRFFVWYDNKLDVPIGSTVILTYENWGEQEYWYKLTNKANGKEANVNRYLKL